MKILITGGNKGIGLATTRLLVEHGHSVVSLSRAPGMDAVLRSASVIQIACDLENVEGIAAVVDGIGPVDALVNNAGFMSGLSYDQYTAEMERKTMRLNLEAPVALMRAVAPAMIAQGHGRIVNNASIAGQIGHPDIWYGISKAGLLNATKSFAKILGPQGVQVSAVAVSPVETAMLDKIPVERRTQFLASTTEKRFAQPLEVAQALYWLACEAPAYLNGACLDLNSASYLR